MLHVIVDQLALGIADRVLYGVQLLGKLYRAEAGGWSADWLLTHQKADGSWDAREKNELVDTCWAILFLRRATRHIASVVYTK